MFEREEDKLKEVGLNIRKFRKTKGLTLKDVASLVDLSANDLSANDLSDETAPHTVLQMSNYQKSHYSFIGVLGVIHNTFVIIFSYLSY